MEFCVLFRKIGKNLSNKYIQKALDTAKKSKTDAIEIVSKKKNKKKKKKKKYKKKKKNSKNFRIN